MTELIHFAPIDSTNAKDIHRLQKRLFPTDLRESIGEIAALLKKTEEHMVCNLSFALFDDSKMVGYVFAYVEAKSVYHERDEEVVYIKEVALLPGYEVM